jgi:ankyrin repeat protein
VVGVGAPAIQQNAAEETALHIASRNNYVAGVEILIQRRMSVDMITSYGWTVLQLAADTETKESSLSYYNMG